MLHFKGLIIQILGRLIHGKCHFLVTVTGESKFRDAILTAIDLFVYDSLVDVA